MNERLRRPRSSVPPMWLRWCILAAIAVAAVAVLAASRSSLNGSETSVTLHTCDAFTVQRGGVRGFITELSATKAQCAEVQKVVTEHEMGMSVEARRGYTCSSFRTADDGRDANFVSCLGPNEAEISWSAFDENNQDAIESSGSGHMTADEADPDGAGANGGILLPLKEAYEDCKDSDGLATALELEPDGRHLRIRIADPEVAPVLDCLLEDLDAPEDLARAIHSPGSLQSQDWYDVNAGMGYTWSYAEDASVTLEVQDWRFG